MSKVKFPDTVVGRPSDIDLMRLAKAHAFAAKAHTERLIDKGYIKQRNNGARRGSSGGEYSFECASLLATIIRTGRDVDLTIAVLLHDSGITDEQLLDDFGVDVTNLKEKVAEDAHLPKEEREGLQVKLATNKAERARLIEIADKISNLRSLANSPQEGWSPARKHEYAIWESRVVDGYRGVNPWLEDKYATAFGLTEAKKPETVPVISVAREGCKPFNAGVPVDHLGDLISQSLSTSWEFTLHPRRIPQAVEQLRQSGQDDSWLVFLFNTTIKSLDCQIAPHWSH